MSTVCQKASQTDGKIDRGQADRQSDRQYDSMTE